MSAPTQKDIQSVRERFTTWDGHPKPKRPFAQEWIDFDAMAAHIVMLEATTLSVGHDIAVTIEAPAHA